MLGILKCRLCGEYPTLKTCQEPAGRFSATIEHKCIRGNSAYIHYGFGKSAEDAENQVIIFWNDDHGVRDPALKPCPFCGEQPRIQRDFRWPRSGPHEGERVDAFEVVCDNFNCPIYHTDNKYFLSEEDAVKAWNRRA